MSEKRGIQLTMRAEVSWQGDKRVRGHCLCLQEGSGPCLFCGAVVCTPEEEEWMTKDSRKAKKLREHFLKKHNIEVSSWMDWVMYHVNSGVAKICTQYVMSPEIQTPTSVYNYFSSSLVLLLFLF